MTVGPRHPLVQPEVLAVRFLCFLQTPLVHEERTQGVSSGLHEPPGFIVHQFSSGRAALQVTSLAKNLKGLIWPAVSVRQLSLKKLPTHLKDVAAPVVVHQTTEVWHALPVQGHPVKGSFEQDLLLARFDHITISQSVRQAAGIVRCANRNAIQVLIRRQWVCQNLLPPPEAHPQMILQRYEAITEVRERTASWRWPSKETLREHSFKLFGSGSSMFVVPEEHGGVHLEMRVVSCVQGVEGVVVLAFQKESIDSRRCVVPFHCILVVPHQDVDVGRHVGQVPSTTSKLHERVALRERSFRERGHLQGMDHEMAEPWVWRVSPSLNSITTLLQKFYCFQRPGRSWRRLSCLHIPQCPGRDA
mmetsp:Transcript_5489/g.15749  ORF Transcript_5489/g.15749 Transcript_5489/m.15749 type:complete len:360 (+) Transcript_5489:222-1301(+)